MKESTKFGLVSVACVFLVVTSIALAIITATMGKWLFVVWNVANTIWGTFLAVKAIGIRKRLISAGE